MSIKRPENADAIATHSSSAHAVVVQKVKSDTNKDYPYIWRQIIGDQCHPPHPTLTVKVTPYEFQAIVYWGKLKANRKYSCAIEHGGSTLYKYSEATIAYINDLSADDLNKAIKRYKKAQKAKRDKPKAKNG